MAPSSGWVAFETKGSTFDTLLAVYTGRHYPDLKAVAANDDSPDGGLTSSVRFHATEGTTYHVAVDGYHGASGDVVLHWAMLSPVRAIPPQIGRWTTDAVRRLS